METVEQYDKFIEYALNVDIIDFRNDFYDGKWDSRVQEKAMLMRNNFGEFWCSLDNGSKKKYIKLVEKYYESN